MAFQKKVVTNLTQLLTSEGSSDNGTALPH
jgi:hypothetical protein